MLCNFCMCWRSAHSARMRHTEPESPRRNRIPVCSKGYGKLEARLFPAFRTSGQSSKAIECQNSNSAIILSRRRSIERSSEVS